MRISAYAYSAACAVSMIAGMQPLIPAIFLIIAVIHMVGANIVDEIRATTESE